MSKKDDKKIQCWYYVDGYVQRTELLTKKKAEKIYGSPVFETFERAENYRLASIYGG